MKTPLKLTLIKVLHTLIWLFFNVVIFYLIYAVIMNQIDIWVWICIGLVVLEGLVLLLFKTMCPVTLLARQYSDSDKHNFDIYLPEWLAKYNKPIYTTLFVGALLILMYQLFLR